MLNDLQNRIYKMKSVYRDGTTYDNPSNLFLDRLSMVANVEKVDFRMREKKHIKVF